MKKWKKVAIGVGVAPLAVIGGIGAFGFGPGAVVVGSVGLHAGEFSWVVKMSSLFLLNEKFTLHITAKKRGLNYYS